MADARATADALRRRGEAFLAAFDDVARANGGTSATTRAGDGGRTKERRDADRGRARGDGTTTTREGEGGRARFVVTSSSGRAAAVAPTVRTMVFDGKRTRDARETTTTTTTTANGGRMIDAKRARKAFMSAEASKVFAEDVERKREMNDDEGADGGMSAERLRAFREEVRRFGAAGLSKWDRQELETERLIELGMKPKKAPRMAPSLGLGLNKANEKREEAKRQEMFALGYKLEKKSKKGNDGAKDRDRGLAWGDSTFSNGVLKVKKRDMVNADKFVDTKAMLRSGPSGRGGSSGGKKKSGKKKAGRKSKR